MTASRNHHDQPAVRVVFRYDDCSAKSSGALERALVQAFADCGAQITLGIIPFVCAGDFHDLGLQKLLPLPADKADMLRRAAWAGHVEIALHGYCHQRWHGTRSSELAGLSVAEQHRRIREGKEELERRLQVRVMTLIPPWNAYDAATVRAMLDTGLECLSASLRGPFERGSGIRFLPASCWLHGLRVVAAAAHRLRRLCPVLVVLLHDYDFKESGHKDSWLTVAEFASRLREVARQPDVRLCSLGQAYRQGVGFSPEKLIPQQVWRRAFRGLSWRYRILMEDQVLWARAAASGSCPPVWCYQACVSFERVVRDLLPAVRRRLLRIIPWLPKQREAEREAVSVQ